MHVDQLIDHFCFAASASCFFGCSTGFTGAGDAGYSTGLVTDVDFAGSSTNFGVEAGVAGFGASVGFGVSAGFGAAICLSADFGASIGF